MLNNYEGACCSKFRKGGSKPSRRQQAVRRRGNLPEGLDRSMISVGDRNGEGARPVVRRQSQAKGKVKVQVKVGGDGRVSNVTVESSPDASLGACVRSAVQRASFAKTQSGGSFSYPFMF